MKKEESDIIDLALDCYKREGYGTGEYCHETSFVWGYQEGYERAKKDFTDKACKWLTANLANYFGHDSAYSYIEDFRKAMEDRL